MIKITRIALVAALLLFSGLCSTVSAQIINNYVWTGAGYGTGNGVNVRNYNWWGWGSINPPPGAPAAIYFNNWATPGTRTDPTTPLWSFTQGASATFTATGTMGVFIDTTASWAGFTPINTDPDLKTKVNSLFITGGSWNFSGNGVKGTSMQMQSSGSVWLADTTFTFTSGVLFESGTFTITGHNVFDVYQWDPTQIYKNTIRVMGNNTFQRSQTSNPGDPVYYDIGNRFIVNKSYTLTVGVPETFKIRATGIDAFNTNPRDNVTYVKGGVFYVEAGANIRRQVQGIGARLGGLEFVDNLAHRGAAFYSEQNLTVEGNTLFDGNEASAEGGAIYMAGSDSLTNKLTLDTSKGDIALRNNLIYGGNNKRYTDGNVYKTDAQGRYIDGGGNIIANPVLQGGIQVTGTLNSIFLKQKTAVEIIGQAVSGSPGSQGHRVYIEDGIQSSTDPIDLGGNSLLVNLIGTDVKSFVQFGKQSNSVLNLASKTGGAVEVRQGEFRILDGGLFQTFGSGTSTFTVGEKGLLAGGGNSGWSTIAGGQLTAGGGTIGAESGFVIRGIVSPDNYVYDIPAVMDGSGTYENPTGNAFGYLNLKGNVTLDGATMQIDLTTTKLKGIDGFSVNIVDEVLKSDILLVDEIDGTTDSGNLMLSGDSKTTINLSTWASSAGTVQGGKYVIATSTREIRSVDGIRITQDNINEYFNEIIPDGVTSTQNKRRGATLFVDQDLLKKGEHDLVLQTSNDGNVNLIWTGKYDQITWDDSSENWKRRLEYPDPDNPGQMKTIEIDLAFRNGDYVIFNDKDNVQSGVTEIDMFSVSPVADWNVAGMRVESGKYMFYSSSGNHTIDGRANNTYVGATITGRLDIMSIDPDHPTELTLNLATDFEKGTRISDGAKVTLAQDDSLGVYVGGIGNEENERGTVTITNSTGTLVTSYYGDNRNLQNHFELIGNSAVTFEIPDATTLTISGVDTSESVFADPSKKSHQGGAFFVDNRAEILRTNANRMILERNTAKQGGAIYAKNNLVLEGNLLIRDNTATEQGGGVYMEGGSAQSTLTFDTDKGDIVFAGNNDASGPNSVFMKERVKLSFIGDNHVFLDDPFTTTANGSNNSFTMDGTGVVQLQGNNFLNRTGSAGGKIEINSGTLRFANGGTLFTGGRVNTASFTLADGARLAGTGTISVERDNDTSTDAAIVIRGTIAPDSDVFTSKLHGAEHLIVADGARIGILTLVSNKALTHATILFDGAEYAIDLGNANASDLVAVTGKTRFAAADKTKFNITSSVANAGIYQLMTSSGKFFLEDGATLLTNENINDVLELQVGGVPYVASARNTAELRVNATNDVITLEFMSNNLGIIWNGTNAATTWNDDAGNLNWLHGNDPEYFRSHDYVRFTDVAESKDVVVGGAWTVVGMEVTDGDYTFYDDGVTPGRITGVAGNIKDGINDVAKDGSLLIDGGNAEIGVATQFVGGTRLNDGKITVAHNDALGIYNHANYPADKQGYVDVTGVGTVATNAVAPGGAAQNYEVVNRFDVKQNGQLTFDIGEGEKLTVKNINIGNLTDGGAVFVAAGGNLANVGNGTLAFNNNAARNGGAIYANDRLALGGTTEFTGNRALGAGPNGSGGAIYARNGIDLNGKATFTDNRATGQSGGAVYSGAAVNITGETTFTDNVADADGGAISAAAGNIAIDAKAVFDRNRAGNDGGAVHAAAGSVVIGAGADESEFKNNETENGGGAIFAQQNVTINAETTFEENRADDGAAIGSGGAIEAVGNVTINGAGTVFRANESRMDGGAIRAFGDVEVLAATTFIGNEAITGSGGAIDADGDITIAGGTKFVNNRANVDGGAIRLQDGNTLTLNADGADADTRNEIVFSGNVAARGNAVYAGENAVVDMISTLDNAKVYFGDAFFFNATGGIANVNMQGTNSMAIIGNAATASRAGEVNVNAGALQIYGAGLQADAVNVNAGGTLAGQGPVVSPVIVDGGKLDPNGYTYQLNANNEITGPLGNAIGVLNVQGDLTLDGATIVIDTERGNPLAKGVADLVDVDGSVLAPGEKNTITIRNFNEGTFDFLTMDDDFTQALKDQFELDQESSGGRTAARIEIKTDVNTGGNSPVEKTLQIVTEITGNAHLFWTGNVDMTGASDQTWYSNNTKNNWIVDEDVDQPDSFVTGDYVVFNNENYVLQGTPQTVNINGTPRVAGMEIVDGVYTFNGVDDQAGIESTNLSKLAPADVTESLLITGANTGATFNVTVDFDKDLKVENGAEATFGKRATFGRNALVDNSDAVFNETLTVGNDLSVNTAANANTSNAFTVTGAAVVGNDATIRNVTEATFGDTLTVGNIATKTGNLVVEGTEMTVADATTVGNNATIDMASDATFEDATIGNNLTVRNESVATFTGALAVGDRGAGTGNLTVDDSELNVDGITTVAGNATIENASTATLNETTVDNNLSITGISDMNVTGTLTVGNAAGSLEVDASKLTVTDKTTVRDTGTITRGSETQFAAADFGNNLTITASEATFGGLLNVGTHVNNASMIVNNDSTVTAEMKATIANRLVVDGSEATFNDDLDIGAKGNESNLAVLNEAVLTVAGKTTVKSTALIRDSRATFRGATEIGAKLWVTGSEATFEDTVTLKVNPLTGDPTETIVNDGSNAVFNKTLTTDKFAVYDSEATLVAANSIKRGTELDGAVLYIGDDKSLDEFNNDGNGKGNVDVTGDSTVEVLPQKSLQILNRFDVGDDAALTLKTVASSNLTLKNGGDVLLGNGSSLVANVAEGTNMLFNSKIDGNGGANQTFRVLGGGTVTFQSAGNKVLGATNVDNGTMTVLTGADFTTNTFTLADGSTLSGEGIVTANNFTIDGILSAGDVLEKVGTLTLDVNAPNGSVTFGDVEIQVDIDTHLAGQRSDEIKVLGGVKFATNPGAEEGTVIVNLQGDWVQDEYLIVSTTDRFEGNTEQEILSHFAIQFHGIDIDDLKRLEAKLVVRDDLKNLYIALDDAKSVALVWDGTVDDKWDFGTENWFGKDDPAMEPTTFLNNDYVIFRNSARESDVDVVNNVTVGGMAIESGQFTFSNGKITGKAGDLGDGSLEIGSAGNTVDVTFNNATAFEGGIQVVGNAAIGLGNDNALGSTASENGLEGSVTVGPGVTASVNALGNRKIANSFNTLAGSTFNLTAGEGSKLTVSNTKGAAIDAAGNVNVAGNVVFDGNNGHAIGMGADTQLSLNADTGDIIFQNSANSVLLANGAGLEIKGDNDILFYDPIQGAGTGTFVKNGNGTVYFHGDNILGSNVNAQVNQGGFRLVDGASFNVGDGTFRQAGSLLEGRGTIVARGSITLSGDISPDDLDDTGSALGRFDLVGNTTFDGATYLVDLNGDRDSDKIVIDGNADFTGTNTVSLSRWALGRYDLILSDLGGMGSEDFWTVNLNGEDLPTEGRLKATLKKVDDGVHDILQLTTEGSNALLVWNNTTGNRLWDSASQNWKNDGRNDYFLEGDSVLFQTAGQGNVKVLDDVYTSDMTIGSGDYTFTGADIYGRKGISTMGGTTGALYVKGGSATFTQLVDFEGGIAVTGGSVALDEDGRFVTDGTFTLGQKGTLTFTPESGKTVIDAKTVNLNGNVVVGRPDTSEAIDDVIVSKTGLDEDRMYEIFNVTYGLTRQYASSRNAFLSVDLLFDEIPLNEFADIHDLVWNEREVADSLTWIFDHDQMSDLKAFLYNCLSTDEEVIAALDFLRGTEQAADAQMMALWRPWERIFRQFLGDNDPIQGSIVGQEIRKPRVRNVWFEGYYRYMESGNDGNARKYRENRGGMMVGIDTRLTSDTTIGITFGYGNPRLTSRFGKIEAYDYTAALYSRSRLYGETYLQGFLGFGCQRYDYERNAFGSMYTSKHNGNSLYASLEAVRPIRWRRGITLLPVIALDYQCAWTRAFEEEGLVYGQRFESSSLDQLVARVGLNTKIRSSDRFNLKTRFQYGHLLAGDTHGTVGAQFIASPTSPMMNLRGVNLGRNQLNIGVGGDWYVNDKKRIKVFGDYDFDCSKRSTAHTGQIGAIVLW